MHLYLSSSSPLNSVFATEDGQVLYKVQSPFKLSGRTATISRVVPNLVPADPSEGSDLQDRYVHLALIEFRSIGSSVIRVGGEELETKHYLRKEGWGWYGRHRVFIGPDGKEYRWMLNTWTSKLVTNDGSKTPIAYFHQKRYGVFGKKRPAFLEITPAGGHMIDVIVYTFVYIEKIRKDKERAARSNGGGG